VTDLPAGSVRAYAASMRLVGRVLAFAILGVVALLTGLGLLAPWSPSGWFVLGLLGLVAIALLVKDRRPRRGLGLLALVLFLIWLLVRLLGAGDGMIAMRTLPGGGSARWLGRLLDEQDLAVAGARLLGLRERLPATERATLVPALRAGYQQVRRDDAVFPTPVLATLLGRQSPAAFDAVVIEPRAEPKPGVPLKFGVLFLHGHAGGFTLECWLMARAAREIGALTVCPSTDHAGRWADEAGVRIARAGLAYLESRGIKRVFLAGLSNGAAGAATLAPRLGAPLEGLLLVSGAPASGGPTGVPTLVVQGAQDSVAPAPAARAFAERAKATYVELEGGHFLWLLRPRDTREAIVSWLMRQTGYRTTDTRPR